MPGRKSLDQPVSQLNSLPANLTDQDCDLLVFVVTILMKGAEEFGGNLSLDKFGGKQNYGNNY
jgi:hypothetical protein